MNGNPRSVVFAPDPHDASITHLINTVDAHLACNACLGTFRAPAGSKCPGCGAPSVPASEILPRPEITHAPGLDDDIIGRLQARQRELPAQTRALERRLKDLEAARDAAAGRLTETRVMLSARLAKEKDVLRAKEDLEAADIAVAEAKRALGDVAATRRALAEAIVKRAEQRRAALAPEVIAHAKKFAAAMFAAPLGKLDEIIDEAERIAARFEPAFLEVSPMGRRIYRNGTGPAFGVLTFFAVDRYRPKPIRENLADLRELAARL